MRILIFGSSGQVGQEAVHHARTLGWDVISTTRDNVDLLQPETIGSYINDVRPDGILNAAAFTAVDLAETEKVAARAVNALAPEAMALAARALKIPFVHFSTDYVFDGESKVPYNEDDPTSPLGVYGQTKLEGEQRIAQIDANAVTLRLAWVFSAYGKNFLKTMLRLSETRSKVGVVCDQIGAPTAAVDAAMAGLQIVGHLQQSPDKRGLYHLGGTEIVSWAGFAKAIFAAAQLPTLVEEITTDKYPTPTKRPKYSVLATHKLPETFGIQPSDWPKRVEQAVLKLRTTQ